MSQKMNETNLSLEGKYLILLTLLLEARAYGFWERRIHFGLYFSIFLEFHLNQAKRRKERSDVTPQTRGSVDYPSTRGIQVDVGLPDATSDNRADFPLYGELYPNTLPA